MNDKNNVIKFNKEIEEAQEDVYQESMEWDWSEEDFTTEITYNHPDDAEISLTDEAKTLWGIE